MDSWGIRIRNVIESNWKFGGLTAFLVLSTSCMSLNARNPIETPGALQETFEPIPSDTPVSQPSLTPVPTGTSELSALTASPPASVSLIMVGNAFNRESLSLLGGYHDGTWLDAERTTANIDINGEYRTFILDGQEQVTGITSVQQGSGPVEYCNQPEYHVHTEVELQPLSVGLSTGWPALPRMVEWLSNQNAFYLQAVDDYLRVDGVVDPEVQIKQILRVDLEGDGVDEVLIAASRFVEPSGHSVTSGDYSLVLMRKLVGGEVLTQRVIGETYARADPLAFPPTHEIQGILDVNADGRMELLVYRQVWEGYGTILFELVGDQLREVLRHECGL